MYNQILSRTGPTSSIKSQVQLQSHPLKTAHVPQCFHSYPPFKFANRSPESGQVPAENSSNSLVSFYRALRAMWKRANMHPPTILKTSSRRKLTQSHKHNTSKANQNTVPQSQPKRFWWRRATRSVYSSYNLSVTASCHGQFGASVSV